MAGDINALRSRWVHRLCSRRFLVHGSNSFVSACRVGGIPKVGNALFAEQRTGRDLAKLGPAGGTSECNEQDVNRRSLEPHRRAPELEEALAPSWRARLAASLCSLQEPQAAPRPSVLGAKASQVEVELAPSWRAHLAASLRALQEPQATPRPSELGAKASQVEVELAPSWRAHLAASLRALQEPQAARRSSVLGAKASQFGTPTRLCKNAFVLDFLAASCAASPLLPAKHQQHQQHQKQERRQTDTATQQERRQTDTAEHQDKPNSHSGPSGPERAPTRKPHRVKTQSSFESRAGFEMSIKTAYLHV